MKKILGIGICMLVIATCLPVTGTIDDNDQPYGNITPFWTKEHDVSIYMKLWVYESGDPEINEPGEYYFLIFALPIFKHIKTEIYEVGDEHPETPYYIPKQTFTTKYTPLRIIILAIEEDKGEGIANTNEFMDYTMIRFKPPAGDYPPSNPYSEPKITWNAGKYFTADISISFHYM